MLDNSLWLATSSDLSPFKFIQKYLYSQRQKFPKQLTQKTETVKTQIVHTIVFENTNEYKSAM